MSSGPAAPESSGASEPVRRHPALSPGLKQLGYSLLAAIVIACFFYFGFLRRHEGLLQSQEQKFDTLKSFVSDSDESAKKNFESLKAERDALHVTLQNELEKVRQANATLQQQVNERKSDLAVAKAKLTRVKAEGQQARQQIDKLLQERIVWKTKFESLLTDDRGRRIAADEAHVALTLPVLQRVRASDSEIAGWSTELDELMQPLNIAQQANDGEAAVSESHAAAVSAIAKSARLTLDELQRDMRLLETIIQQTQSVTVGTTTLRDAASQAEVAEATKLALAVAEARKVALAAQSEALQKAEQERIAAETRVKEREQANETAKLSAREDMLIAQAREEELKRQTAIAQEKLEREFAKDLPEVRRLLSAFIDDGFQRRGRQEGKGPMSYAAIEGAGALAKTSAGRQALAILVGHSDRPSGPLPRFQGGQTRSQEELCTRAQELLTKYGPLMIEKKMLVE